MNINQEALSHQITSGASQIDVSFYADLYTRSTGL